MRVVTTALLVAMTLSLTSRALKAADPTPTVPAVTPNRGIPMGAIPTVYPTLPSLGPRPDDGVVTPVLYKRVADGDWRVGDSQTRAPFNFANGARDVIVSPGDRLLFQRATFEGSVNLGPVWNYSNDNDAQTSVVFEDCVFKGSVSVSTIGKMKVELRHSSISGLMAITASPDSLVTVSNVSVVASRGGDAARIGRPRNQAGHPYGPDSKTPVVMRDCLVRTSGPSSPGDHRDAMQIFGGAGITCSNVVFDLNYGEYPGLGEGQNAALFIEDGSNGSVHDIDLIDCWILGSGSYYLMGIQCRAGSTSTNIRLIRPRISRGVTPLYGTDHAAFQRGAYTVDSPVYSDDLTPVALAHFGL